MQNIHVSLYWRDRVGRDGLSPLLLAVNYGGSSTYVPISNVRLAPGQWDKKSKRVVNHPRAAVINSVCQSLLGRAEDALLELTRNGGTRGWSLVQVKNAIVDILFPAEAGDDGVVAVMEQYRDRCRAEKTAEKFSQTLVHLERWLGVKAKRLEFADVTVRWLEDFERYMEGAGLSMASRGIHLRNMRTVFNYALTNDLTGAKYPFRQFRIKSQPSRPNALTLEQLRRLWHHEPRTVMEGYWKDMFFLSFMLLGINMADLCAVRRLNQGRLDYTRQKTGKSYSVKVEPEAMALIEAHKGRKHLVDVGERFKGVHVASSQANKFLKPLAAAAGLDPITMYTARYTWASVAASIDVPIEVISQALGHSYGLAVTLGYIMPDRRKVDEANRRVLDLLGS